MRRERSATPKDSTQARAALRLLAAGYAKLSEFPLHGVRTRGTGRSAAACVAACRLGSGPGAKNA